MFLVHRFTVTKKVVAEWFWDRKCVVCLCEVKPSEDILTCPFCGAIGHRSHFLEWLKVKALCPNCKKSLKERDVLKA
ncbi:MAG: hypothetical protein QXK94_09000 [Candidatus Jordarchaeales archaeon]